MRTNTIRLLCLLLICAVLAGQLPLAASATAGNFTIQIPEEANINPGDTVQIPVVVGHTGNAEHYNSFDIRFAYDDSALELISTVIGGMSVTAKDGTVRILRYGDNLALGITAFTLIFRAIKPGKTTVAVTQANIGINETALDTDASAAVVANNMTVLVNTGPYNVTVTPTSGGTVSVSTNQAAAGEKVVITATPQFGYRLKTLTVTAENGENVAVSTDNNGKFSFTMPEANVLVKATFGANITVGADSTNPRTGDDFNLAAWSTAAIVSLLAMLVINKRRYPGNN